MERIPIMLCASLFFLWVGFMSQAASGEPPVAKVRVYRNGKMTLDGKEVTLEELRAGFQELKKRQGVVWYYREAAEREPHPNATLVVQAIVEARLPVSMSNEEDFSTVVLPDGTVRPR